MQAELGFIQPCLHATLEQQTAAAVIGPLVVGANKTLEAAFRLLANDRAAVTTNVIQSVYLSVVGADDDDRISFHVVEEIIAGFGYLARVTGEEPILAPDDLHLGAVKQFVVVERTRQAVARLAGIHQIL